jgi:hypothetical protein
MKKIIKSDKLQWSDQARSFLRACLVVLLAWVFSDKVQGQDTLQLASEGVSPQKDRRFARRVGRSESGKVIDQKAESL